MHVISAKGRLEHCELWGNADREVHVWGGSDTTLATCTLRDHARGAGVHVECGCLIRVHYKCWR